MKLLLTTLALSVLTTITVAQEDKLKVLQDLEMSDTTKYIIVDTTKTNVDTKTVTAVSGKDTTKIRIGKREIVIVEKGGTTSIEIPETGDKHTFDSDKDKNFTYKRKARFKGHWAGFEWGFNGLMDADQSINMQGDLKYLELKQGRSWNFNLNFMQYSFGFGTDKVGLVTGLGLEFNNYHFRNPTSIKVEDGVTVVNNSYALDPNKIVTKSKLSTTYFTAPLLLEFQIPTSYKHRIYFSAGVVGGVKIGSNTKVVYEGTNKGKDKVRDDYNLSPFRYGLTARVGYRKLSLFATYYPVQLFEENKGDEIYPFAIGLRLLSF
ncbi:MAG: outer membrane beta-barrel protein [Tenuifilaceae bacterium]|nr:outer membrane beta-barrel protein [Tenuifilaceae bacterium]